MTTTEPDACRAAFEKWHLDTFRWDVAFNLKHGDIRAKGLFECWQAGRAELLAELEREMEILKCSRFELAWHEAMKACIALVRAAGEKKE